MTNWEPFSKRKNRRAQAGQPQTYVYDDLPEPFRNQVIHILNDTMGKYSDRDPQPNPAWCDLQKMASKELGVLFLGNDRRANRRAQCFNLITNGETLQVLDLIELAFRLIDRLVRNTKFFSVAWQPKQSPDNAIKDLNARFREHSLGYEYAHGYLIQKTDEFAHAEMVMPALHLLHDAGFKGATEEFHQAHEHFRKDNFKDTLTWANKAFESTLKTICEQHQWSYSKNDGAKKLIDTVIANGLIPQYLLSHFSSLRAMLESGLPTLRSKMGAHGQGANPVDVPAHAAAYAIHMAASNIIFLVKSHNAMK